MSELSAFDYAVLRVVPHVEREEFLNVGVILFCRPRAFLGVRIRLDAPRLLALAPQIDLALVQLHLDQVRAVVEGRAEAGALGQMSQSERFHWLTTPRRAAPPSRSHRCTAACATTRRPRWMISLRAWWRRVRAFSRIFSFARISLFLECRRMSEGGASTRMRAVDAYGQSCTHPP